MKKRATIRIDDYYDEIITSSHILQGSFVDEEEQTQTVIILTNDMFKDYMISHGGKPGQGQRRRGA